MSGLTHKIPPRTGHATTPSREHGSLTDRIQREKSFTPSSSVHTAPRYREGSVELYGEGESTGIGKNYDGYRVTFQNSRGFKVHMMKRDLTTGNEGIALATGIEKDECITRFQLDVKKAAETDPKIAAFVEQNKSIFENRHDE